MMKLYDSKLSGNAWKVRLMLRHLDLPFLRETLNLAEGRQKSAEFAAMNPFRRVPVLQLDDGRCLSESAAILAYLAEGTELLPAEPVARAQVLAWLAFEQADLLRFLAYPRFFTMTGQAAQMADVIAHYKEVAMPALARVEEALATRDWIAGHALSVADFGLYAYIRLAPEGGYNYADLSAIRAWLARFEALPRYEALVPESV